MSWYASVPKNVGDNLLFRADIRKWADANGRRQAAIIEACRRDVLFFINTFLWVFEPRRPWAPKQLPFVTYQPFQDEAILQLSAGLGSSDFKIEKSRDLGGTWMVESVFFHDWMFGASNKYGLMSRNEDAVDQKGDSDSLFWKLDFLLGDDTRAKEGPGLPRWMMPPGSWSRSQMKLVNNRNNSTFFGYPATGDAQRGGRKKAILCDEFAAFPKGQDYAALSSLQFVTNSRYYLSTPSPEKGASGAFYDMVKGKSSAVHIVLDWRDHPDRGRGTYRTKTALDGSKSVEIINGDVDHALLARLRQIPVDQAVNEYGPDFDFVRDWPFVLDGTVRGIYYDIEAGRTGASEQILAVELRRDYHGAGFPYFPAQLLQAAKDTSAAPAMLEGDIDFDEESCVGEFLPLAGGKLKLWMPLGPGWRAPDGDFVVGADISAGTAGDFTSNSALVAYNKATREQVARLACNDLFPADFADLTVAFCRWLNDAFLAWEDNGPNGAQFRVQVIKRGYMHFYYRTVEKKVSKRRTKNPGFWSTAGDKSAALSVVRTGLANRTLFIRDEMILTELGEYRWKDGKVVHSKAITTTDHSQSGESHADTAIACAIGVIAMEDRPAVKGEAEEEFKKTVPGSVAWRRKERERAEENGSCWGVW